MEGCSGHAQRRMQQRGVRLEAVEEAIAWGREFHQRGGRTAYFVGRREVGMARRAGEDLGWLARTAVVTGRDGGLITTIKVPDPRRLKRREK